MSHEWAPIIYARTRYVDFRLMAVPEDFVGNRELARRVLRDYILTTTRHPRDLDSPRWSLFQVEPYTIWGITCRAEAIYPDEPNKTLDDTRTRRLYLFIGYVTQATNPTIPPMMSPEWFKPLYRDLVIPNWEVRDYHRQKEDPQQYALLYPAPGPVAPPESTLELNANPAQVSAWATAQNEELWRLAAQQIAIGQNTSLCIGMSRKRDLLDTAFLNATSADISVQTMPVVIAHPTPEQVPVPGSPNKPEATEETVSSEKQDTTPSFSRTSADNSSKRSTELPESPNPVDLIAEIALRLLRLITKSLTLILINPATPEQANTSTENRDDPEVQIVAPSHESDTDDIQVVHPD